LDIKVIGRVPFNPAVTEAMVNERTIIEYSPESDVAGILLLTLGKFNTDDDLYKM